KMFKSNLSKEEVGILTANITKTLQEMNERAENAKKNGKIEGKTEEKIGVAKKAIAKGLDDETISDLTELTIEEIQSIRKSLAS
ncbi:MAG: hypothetical protein RSD26_08460, partial [Cellulosilyticaceae bacterium]